MIPEPSMQIGTVLQTWWQHTFPVTHVAQEKWPLPHSMGGGQPTTTSVLEEEGFFSSIEVEVS